MSENDNATLRKERLERIDHTRFSRNGRKVVFSLVGPSFSAGDHGQEVLDILRAGNKKFGYHYAIVTFSESTFNFLWLTEDERVSMIAALGGSAT